MNTELLSSPWIYVEPHNLWSTSLPDSKAKKFKRKEVIIHEHTHINCLYYLKTGRVKTVASSSSGHQKILWYLDAGCFFGETAFFNQKLCDYSFVALTECEVYIFPREAVSQLITTDPTFALSLITMLTRKVHILSTQVEDVSFNKPLIRVAKLIYLLHQSNSLQQQTPTSDLPLNQEDIANMLGLHRVTINQALRYLKEIDALHTDSHIIVKNLDTLKKIFIDC